jgi:predicted transcriptional regulator
LSPGDTLGHATDLLLAGTQQVFPVIIDGRHAGVLTRDALLKGLSQQGREGRIAEAPLRELGRVDAGAPLVPALARLREGGEPCLQVVEQDEPVGLLTLENIGEYLMVRAALGGPPSGIHSSA